MNFSLLEQLETPYQAEQVCTAVRLPADRRPGANAPLEEYKQVLLRWVSSKPDERGPVLDAALRRVLGIAAAVAAPRVGPPGGAAPTQAPGQLTLAQVHRLVDALERVPMLTDPNSRNQIIQLLPGPLQNFPRAAVLRLDLTNLVRHAASHPEGLAKLLEVLELMDPGGYHLGALQQAVADTLREMEGGQFP